MPWTASGLRSYAVELERTETALLTAKEQIVRRSHHSHLSSYRRNRHVSSSSHIKSREDVVVSRCRST